MSQYTRFLSSLIAVVLMMPGLSMSAHAAIHDNGDFFSEQAKLEAARKIAELERSVRKNLTIETFKELPDDVRRGANLQDKAALNRLFEAWTVKQAREEGINGVYVLLVRTPAHLQVVVGNDTQKRAFTLRDRDLLVSTMLVKLRAKQYDEALFEGVNFVSSTMRANMGAGSLRPGFSQPGTVRRSAGFGWLIPLLVGLLVVWVVVGIFRSIFRGGGASGGITPGAPMSGGGGGFLSSLFGGMLGAGAGMWMYNQFFGDRGSSAWGAERENLDNGDRGSSGQDTEYSSSGDSFGDTSGGVDSGGGSFGDSSGGNFGGGDGGGDSGGGDF